MGKETGAKGGQLEMEYRKQCICERCPSHVDCNKQGGTMELAFCHHAIGKSKCIKQQRGCICGACPIKQRMKLKNFYFCILGSEEEQNKKKQ